MTNDIRISWIDIAKFMGIIAIVLGHTSAGYLYELTFSFNSVIFFILAGMTFCRIKGDYDNKLCFDNRKSGRFLLSIFKTILIPYYIWGVVSILIYAVVGKLVTSQLELSQSHYSILGNLVGMLYGNSESGYFEWNRPLWFLTALASVEVMWFLTLKWMYSRKSEKSSRIIYISCMTISLVWMVLVSVCEWNLVLPMELETALGMYFFFGIGLLVRSVNWEKTRLFTWIVSKKTKNLNIGIFLFFGCLLSSVLTCMNGGTDTRSDYFSNIALYIINALVACGTVIGFSRCVGNNQICEYIGKRTMAILVMHKFPIMFLKTLFPVINAGILEGNILISVGVCIITIGLCLLVEKPVSLILPEVFGRSRKQKRHIL